MKSPIVAIFGRAGAGKSTAASIIAARTRGVQVSFADPLKRLAQALFGFSEQSLWGTSDLRNQIQPHIPHTRDAVERHVFQRRSSVLHAISQIFGQNGQIDVAYEKLRWTVLNLIVPWGESAGGLSARVVCQTLGTDWARAIDPDIWVRLALETSHRLLSGGHDYSHSTGIVTRPGQSYDTVVIADGRFRNEALSIRQEGGWTIHVSRPDSSVAPGVRSSHLSETELSTIPQWWYDHSISAPDGELESLIAQASSLAAALTGYR